MWNLDLGYLLVTLLNFVLAGLAVAAPVLIILLLVRIDGRLARLERLLEAQVRGSDVGDG